jgi:hypothetical protein
MASPIYGVRLGLSLGQPSRYIDSHNLVSWAKSRRTREELGFYFQKKKERSSVWDTGPFRSDPFRLGDEDERLAQFLRCIKDKARHRRLLAIPNPNLGFHNHLLQAPPLSPTRSRFAAATPSCAVDQLQGWRATRIR